MKTKFGYADFTFFLSKFRTKRIGDSEILDKAAQLNLQCVQVSLALNLEDGGVSVRKALREKAERLGIELIGAGYGPAEPAELEKAILAGKELGARIVRHACGPFRLMKPPLPRRQIIANLKKAARVAEREGVTLAIENHQDYVSADLAAIMKSVGSPRVGVWLDTGNSIALLEDPIDTARTLAPYTRGVHLKEYAVLPSAKGFDLVGVLLGQGVVDNAAALKIVRNESPEKTLLVTLENPLERCVIPLLSTAYVTDFARRRIGDLAALTALIEKSREKFTDGIRLPQESGLTDDEIVAIEDQHNRQAVEYARKNLGL